MNMARRPFCWAMMLKEEKAVKLFAEEGVVGLSFVARRVGERLVEGEGIVAVKRL